MRIVNIIPGSGDAFYCQNCLRDRALVEEMKGQGHDVIFVPMYLPILVEGAELDPQVPVFYGAVSVYLGQYLPFLRGAPQWMKRMIDSRGLLSWIAQKAGTTRASGLERMTLSILNGETGEQKAELDRLVEWLVLEGKPDVVHLSTILLIGLAKRIKQELNVPVVCTLQDEDTWIDSMEQSAVRKAWQVMSERSTDIAAFLSVSEYYSQLMQERLHLPRERINLVPIGIDTNGYAEAQIRKDQPVIGYLSKMTPSLGLERLVDAFMVLKKNPRLKRLRLKITGGKTNDDRPFIQNLKRKLEGGGFGADVEFLQDFDRKSRIEFLESLSVLSVPSSTPEAFGTYIIEALASGVPVVQPRLGAFPELIDATGGGLCYEPNDVPTLVKSLESLLLDPERSRAMGRAGRKVVRERYNIKRMVDSTLEVYRKCMRH